MDRPAPLPRAASDVLARLAATAPVVVLTGARQTGKSTLARMPGAGAGRPYLTLDDAGVLEQARAQPAALLLRGDRLVVDEVQRAPGLLLAVKAAVDEDRQPGRFILTGSANLLLMKTVAESLAGRAVYLTLMPMTRREQLGFGRTGNWRTLLDNDPRSWRDILEADEAPEEPWQDLARRGGYPEPAYHLTSDSARRDWFDGYAATYLERDLREIAAIDQVSDFRRLMSVASLRIGNLVNQADLARDAGIAPTTAQRYLGMLDVTYQTVRLPAYAVNRTKRLIKAPKLYWTDTGLAMFLAGETDPRGAHLENIVLADLLAWSALEIPRPSVLYWRTAKGAEVDFVIEDRGSLLPIEVKSGAARLADARHLETFLDEYADRVRAGVLLTTAGGIYWLTRRVLAAPWWTIV
jgi:predicted AAA+ superfamily ATPase